MIEPAGISEFDDYLENEFSKLGFNYQEIKANGLNGTTRDKFELFAIDYLDDPYMQADGIAVIFTLTNPANEQKPVIETMDTVLFNDSCY